MIGNSIARELIQSGYEVHAVYSKNADSCLLKGIESKICFHNIDLIDFEESVRLLKSMDSVIHASIIRPFECYSRSDLILDNIKFTEHLINLAIEAGTRKFVFVSCASILKEKAPNQLIAEDSFKYSDSKSMLLESIQLAEQEVWRGKAEGLNICILNPSIILGPCNSGSSSCSIFDYVYTNGMGYSNGSNGFVDVRDLAMSVVRSLDDQFEFQQLVISGHNLKINELFDLINKYSNVNFRLRKRSQLSLSLFGKYLIFKDAILSKNGLNSFFNFSLLNEKLKFSSLKSEEILGSLYRDINITIEQCSKLCLKSINSDDSFNFFK